MLQIVDQQWKDHLYSLDHLKEGIGLRGYGQRDPLVEYKKESFSLFQAMKDRVDEEIVRYLWWLRPMVSEDAVPRRQAQRSLILSGGGSAQLQPAFAGAAPVRFGRRRCSDRRAVVRGPRASAATMRPSRPSAGTSRRSAGTIRVPAAAARSTRSATALLHRDVR